MIFQQSISLLKCGRISIDFLCWAQTCSVNTVQLEAFNDLDRPSWMCNSFELNHLNAGRRDTVWQPVSDRFLRTSTWFELLLAVLAVFEVSTRLTALSIDVRTDAIDRATFDFKEEVRSLSERRGFSKIHFSKKSELSSTHQRDSINTKPKFGHLL